MREDTTDECPRTITEIVEDLLAGRSVEVSELRFLRRTDADTIIPLRPYSEYVRLGKLLRSLSHNEGILRRS
jgi:hypothetical protein